MWPTFDQDHVLVSADEMFKIEAELIASGFSVEALMQKVGQSMADWFLEKPSLLENGVLVLVGPGHNGGDGLVVARELHSCGVDVRIWCPLAIKKPLTSENLRYANWLGIEQIEDFPEVDSNELWIEALFGLGQVRSLPKEIANLFQERERVKPGRLVSLDVPAGLCSDSGMPMKGGAAFADFTLTVGLIKKGLIQDAAIAHVGHLVRIGIGLSSKSLEFLPKTQPLCIHSFDLKKVNWPRPPITASKYERGRLLVAAGSNRYPGASMLALRGSLASGAGSLHAVLPELVANSLWQVAPEVVIAGSLNTSSNEDLASFFNRDLDQEKLFEFDAVLLGPGLDKSDGDWLASISNLQGFPGLLVCDADALNRLALTNEGWRWFTRRKGPTWITPHEREFKRLFPELKDELFLNAAVEAAQISGTSVLLKGAHSVVADRDGFSWQICSSVPWVARAGLGDLLAGFVAGVGAIAFSSEGNCSGGTLAAAALVHSKAAKTCKEGTLASSVGDSLAKLTRAIQNKMS